MTRSLGRSIAGWLMANLPSPGDYARPLVLTPDQLDFLADWYAVDDRGRFVYRRGAIQGAKGTGKSPTLALVAIAELAGPVVFDHFDAAGEPVGRPWADPLVQLLAVAEEQAQANTYSVVFELLRANERRAAERLGLDEGRGRVFLRGRPGKLEAVTSSAGAREGQRVTCGIVDESHHLTKGNGGLAAARTVLRNAAKVGGRVIESANAPELGLGSLAEATLRDASEARPGVLLVARRPSRTPEPDMGDAELLELLGDVYGGAPWVDTARILAEVRDPATPWDESVRYYFNQPAGGAAVLVEPSRWAALAGPPAPFADGARVWLGFDGSYSQDGTALVAVDETGRLSVELMIERDPHDPPGWTVPRVTVHETLAEVFARFDVVRLFADPWHWRDELAEWTRLYGEDRIAEYPTNSGRRFGPAVDRFRTALAEGRLSHDGDPDLARHVLNARLVRGRAVAGDDGRGLFTLAKPGPGRLIDAAVASVLAYEAMATTPAPLEEPEPRVRVVGVT